jgi:hypothetical protein
MDAYLLPPPLNTNPGPEFADDVRMWQGIPSIERSPGGRLWAAWYAGGVTEDRYNYVMVWTSGDGGASWQLVLVIDPDKEGIARAYDPCPWVDPLGRLWLFWGQGNENHTEPDKGVWAIVTEEPESPRPAWSSPRRLGDGVMMNKPLVTSWGEWLICSALWHKDDSCRVFASADKGATWERIGAASVVDPKERNCDEHMIVERRDGSLWMLVRTTYGIGESVSTDRGRTWTPVAPTGIQNPTTRFYIGRLRSGRLLLVKNGPVNERIGRARITAVLSEDDGKTWAGGLVLDPRGPGHGSGDGCVSYPDATQAADGTIHCIHDFDRAGDKEILYSRFTEEDVLAGRALTPDTALAKVLNRATALNPNLKPKA